MHRWIGPAAWGPREAKAGDRLPYARHLDGETIALRDGSAMRMIQVPGIMVRTPLASSVNSERNAAIRPLLKVTD